MLLLLLKQYYPIVSIPMACILMYINNLSAIPTSTWNKSYFHLNKYVIDMTFSLYTYTYVNNVCL